MDPIAPSITFFDKEGKGRVNYIGNLVPEKVFYPTPGLWFSNQNDEVQLALFQAFEKQPYPTDEEIEELSRSVDAPSIKVIHSFYRNMQQYNQQQQQQ
ncbi:unnamed protein product [Bathycoccus prasinos]